MVDSVDTLDRIVECAILGNIFDDNQLKPVTIMGEFIVEEGRKALLGDERTVQRTDSYNTRLPKHSIE